MRNTYRIIGFKFVIILTLTILFTAFCYKGFGKSDVGIDDANISFIYAKHLSQGNGFVYNIGGERVEGFSSFLWVLILALFFCITDNPEILVLVFNTILVSLALTILTIFIDNKFKTPAFLGGRKCPMTYGGLIFLAWVFATPDYICWTTLPLMETGLWSLLLITASSLILFIGENANTRCKYSFLFTPLILLTVLTRPEGILWGLVFLCLLFFVVLITTKDTKITAKCSIVPVLTYIATVLIFTIFRINYFGYPLPNTYYAKMSPNIIYNLKEGVMYFSKFVSSNRFVSLHLLVVVWDIITSRHIKRQHQGLWFRLIISVIILFGISIPIYMGGDHFGSFRFYQPIWPLLILPSYNFFCQREKTIRNIVVLCNFNKQLYYFFIPVLVFFLFSWANDAKWNDLSTTHLTKEFSAAKYGRKTGQFLEQLFQSDHSPTVGTIMAGGIKYSYSGQIIDLMGLNNIAMAHHKGERKGIKNHAAFSKEVFYELAPDIIIPKIITDLREAIPYSKDDWVNGPLKGLVCDDCFLDKYSFSVVKRADVNVLEYLLAYFRNDYLSQLVNSGLYDIMIVKNKTIY